jgi:flagellar biosynthesis/type III secretory pathway protein FliH
VDLFVEISNIHNPSTAREQITKLLTGAGYQESDLSFDTEPLKIDLDEIKEKAYDEGHDDGHSKGFQEGKEEGVDEGHRKGFEKGRKEGFEEGLKKGREESESGGTV